MTTANQDTQQPATAPGLWSQFALPAGSWIASILTLVLVLMVALLALGFLARQFQLVGEMRAGMTYSGTVIQHITVIGDRF